MSAKVATTQWSQVLAAGGNDTAARRALEGLCRTYWQPLYAYVRHQGATSEEASDLTQGFFSELLERRLLADLDPAKGRFRSYLLAALRHYLSRRRDHDRALKRGGGAVNLSLDMAAGEQSYRLRAAEELTPEDLFQYRWAMTVLGRAIARLRQEAADAGNLERFERLRPYLTSEGAGSPYRETAAALGTTEVAIRSAVRRLRQGLGRCLREEIVETVANPGDVDDEVRHLLTIVRP